MRAHVRSWRREDHHGSWQLLRDSSFSNVWPSFISTMSRTSTRAFWAAVVLVCIASNATVWTTIFLILALPVFFYMTCLAATAYFCYGPNFSDVRNVESTYFSSLDNHFWVAEIEGEIVGTIAVVKRSESHTPDSERIASDLLINSPQEEKRDMNVNQEELLSDYFDHTKIAWLRRMAVKQKYRGLGVAKQLVRTAIDFCRQQKYNSIFLITTEFHQPARALYMTMGFKQLAFRPYKYIRGLFSIWTYEFEIKL